MNRIVLATCLAALFAVTPLAAQAEPKHDAADLAMQLANPVASLVSVPFQTNWNFGVGPGPDNDTQFLLNFQPVMPFVLNKEWNLIARAIVPYLSQPPLSSGGAAASGIGDLLVSGFFSPSQSKPFINTWTVPIIAQVSQLVRLGRRPVSIAAGYGYYVASPEGGPNWKFRVALTLLFPK